MTHAQAKRWEAITFERCVLCADPSQLDHLKRVWQDARHLLSQTPVDTDSDTSYPLATNPTR